MLSKGRFGAVFQKLPRILTPERQAGSRLNQIIQHLKIIIILRDHSKLLHLYDSYLSWSLMGKEVHVWHTACRASWVALWGGKLSTAGPAAELCCHQHQTRKGKNPPKSPLPSQNYALNFRMFRNLLHCQRENQVVLRSILTTHFCESSWDLHLSHSSPEQLEKVLVWICMLWLPQSCLVWPFTKALWYQNLHQLFHTKIQITYQIYFSSSCKCTGISLWESSLPVIR